VGWLLYPFGPGLRLIRKAFEHLERIERLNRA
jgi:hypothetical protein